MRKLFKNFRADEDGAVTVDWVMLTAAIVGIGGISILAVSGGVSTLSASTATNITN
ncbi:MAG: Flp family type IVb pilin [Paracoccaceae bacterium]